LTSPCLRSYRYGVLDVTFREPNPDDEADVAEAQRIMAKEDFTFAFGYTPGDDFRNWVEIVAARRLGMNIAPGWVSATYELAIVEMRIAGRLSVRHALNDFLLQQGGHIGYGVLPAYRGQGIGKRMLQRGLGSKPVTEIAKELGVSSSMLHRWRERFEPELTGGVQTSQGEREEIERLRSELRDVKAENTLLKKRSQPSSRRK
jgi:predicted acetyltransferase